MAEGSSVEQEHQERILEPLRVKQTGPTSTPFTVELSVVLFFSPQGSALLRCRPG